jgi:hypothetical protein
MSLYERLVEVVEQTRGAATEARNEEQAWAGRLCEQLAAYLDAPPKAVYYASAEHGRVMLHTGFPQLHDDHGWQRFQLEIATDQEQRHRFALTLRFQAAPSDDEGGERYRIKLGAAGKEFVLPGETEDFFDHIFAAMLADLETPQGREAARQGGVRQIG